MHNLENSKIFLHVQGENGRRILLAAPMPLRRAIFGTTPFNFDLWSRPWGVARLLGLHAVSLRPHPLEEVG